MIETQQATWSPVGGWQSLPSGQEVAKADLVFLLGAREHLEEGAALGSLVDAFANAKPVGCSTEVTGRLAGDAEE